MDRTSSFCFSAEESLDDWRNGAEDLSYSYNNYILKIAERWRRLSCRNNGIRGVSHPCAGISAFDRRRIAALEKGKIRPAQKDRGEILKALIAANGGKMLAKDAR